MRVAVTILLVFAHARSGIRAAILIWPDDQLLSIGVLGVMAFAIAATPSIVREWM